ncbi:MAG: Cys-Gln thioester bond-forming surface protein, partial [Anaerotignum sp.]|nr:Cys-Gln thioester bond-forming surface protein [Anaerotignum sp.]
ETTETDRKVTATMGKIETFQSSGNGDANVDAVNPEWTEDKEHVKAPVVFEKYDSLEELLEALKNKPDGYDFLYTGHGEDSLYGVDYGFGGSLHDAGTSTQQFQLTDFSDPNALNGVTDEALRENLDIHTGYCVDLDTESQKGYWYEIENLEDAGYYKTQEAEDHIRAIVMNGYWGTVGTEKDADGNDVPKTGSLDAMKEMLKTAQSDGKLSADIDVDSLTEGEALTATQMAIWKYGNPYESEDGIGLTATTLDSAVYHTDRGGWTEWIYSNDGPYDPYGENIYTNELELNGEKMTSEQVAAAKGRINAIYTYLTGLSMTAEEAGTTEIITEEKVAKVDSLSMTVGEKAEGYAENDDDNDDNDVYNVSLSFALVVEPDKDKDDMVVKVVKIAPDGSMEEVAKARLAGDDTKDEGFNSVAYDETTGSYTLSGLELAENANCEFNLKLEGAQYLEQGVYIYSSEIKNEKSSQTFVGIAEGYKSVDVGMKVDLNFDVKEGTITEKRSYRKVSHDEPTTEPGDDTPPGGGGGGDNPGGNTPDPETDIPEEDVPLAGVEDPVEDIGESDVPLAEDPMVAGEEEIVAATGDSNHMTAGFGGMLMALAGLFGLRKKEN